MSNEDYNESTRREFLQTGAAVLGLGSLSPDLRTGLEELPDGTMYDPENEVKYISRWETINKEPGKPPERKAIYETMPIEKKERIDRTEEVEEAVVRVLYDENLDSITTTTEYDKQSSTDLGLKISYDPDEVHDEEIEELLKTAINSELEDIPIVIESEERNLEEFYKQRRFNPVPGGQMVEGIGDGGGLGTLMGPFYSDQHGDGWVSAAHVVGSSGNDVEQNQPPSAAGDARIGEVKDRIYKSWIDVGFIDESDVEITTQDISEKYNTDYGEYIDGIVTDQELKNKLDENFEIHMQGRVSNRESGTLNGIKKDIFGRTIGHTTDKGMAGGDSGGPMFHKDGEFVYMTGLIVGPDPNGPGTRGTTVETIENRLGGQTY